MAKSLRSCRTFLAAALLLPFACAGATAQTTVAPAAKPAEAPAGNADNGKRLFASYGCYECHGPGPGHRCGAAHRSACDPGYDGAAVRSPADRPDAAVHREGSRRSGSGRHRRVSQVAPDARSRIHDSTVESVVPFAVCPSTARETIDEHRQHHQRNRHVEPIPLLRECQHGKRHARDGRRDQKQQAELDQAARMQ